MPPGLKAEEFIKRVAEKHNNRYNYEKTKYTTQKNSIIITCPKHGDFTITADSHLKGYGCTICPSLTSDKAYRYNTNSYIEKAKLKWKDSIDYTQCKYTDKRCVLKLKCNIHNVEFTQIAEYHLSGKFGCPTCVKDNCDRTKEKLKDKYPNIYQMIDPKSNVSENITTGSHNKVNWICVINPEHKWIDNVRHYVKKCVENDDGYYCPMCEKQLTLLINICPEMVQYYDTEKNDNSDISKIYVESRVLVWWKCDNKHSYQMSSYKKVIEKQGCPYCSGKYVSDDNRFTIKFPDVAKEWNYEKNLKKPEDYSFGSSEKVWWKCSKEHEWFVSINARVGDYKENDKTHGCPQCNNNRRYSPVAIEWLEYIMYTENIHIKHAENGGEFYIPELKWYADGYNQTTNTIYEFHGSYWHGDPRVHDPAGFNQHTNKTFGELYEFTKYKEEKIKQSGYKLVVMWEFDWINQKKDLIL
jgi:G:T-mismatch repair DNA endonuclease (very short patch repair protein)